MTSTGRILMLLVCAVMLVAAGCATTGVAPVAEKEDAVVEVLSPEERIRLGTIYESRGELELALREYEQAASEDRANPEAYFVLANVQLRMSMYGPAEDNYRKAIELAPGTGPYHNNLGWLYMERGMLERAEAEVRRAIDADPDRRYVYLDTLGVLQTRWRRFVEAEESLKVAAALTPETETAGLREIYSHLVELYSITGDTEKAASAKARLKGLEAGR